VGIAHHRLRLAIGDDPAGIHADQPLGHLQQDVDDMLDPDDADTPAAQFEDGGDQFARLSICQPAADLIEQHQLRFRGQRPGELKPLAVEKAERIGLPVSDAEHAAERQAVDDALIGFVATDGIAMGRGDEDVFEGGHAAEGFWHLMGAHQSSAAALGG